MVWSRSLDNELGRLTQGFRNQVKGTDTMEFIPKQNVPQDRKVTYSNFVCDYRPLKSEPFRVRMTVGGDKLEYPDETASPAASLIETKLIINCVISDHSKFNSKFCAIDLKDFFLKTPMTRPEFLRIHSRYLSPDFRTEYKLNDLIDSDGYVYFQVNKGMYGLKQAAILAYKLLVQRFKNRGYYPIPLTTGLFKHKTRSTVRSLH